MSESWDELDSWWTLYAETGHATAKKIADLLDCSNEEWQQSDGPFDVDPLAADLTLDRLSRGPLQPTNEVGWSRWLARLLRPSSELSTELFGVEADQHPDEVVREDQLAKVGKQASHRRPDVLMLYPDLGVSIEVKLGDENYKKTADTAKLTEYHYDDLEWTHHLLLPKSKIGRLESIVDPPVRSDPGGELQVAWADPGPVSVIHWRDVTAAIRSLLRRNVIADPHWAANAYLFCAIAEQQLMNFQPQDAIQRLATPTNVVDTIQPVRLAATLEEQLTYLRANLNS
jgi:hypothetical protein